MRKREIREERKETEYREGKRENKEKSEETQRGGEAGMRKEALCCLEGRGIAKMIAMATEIRHHASDMHKSPLYTYLQAI